MKQTCCILMDYAIIANRMAERKTMKRILVHNQSFIDPSFKFYDVTTDEQLYAVALSIIVSRTPNDPDYDWRNNYHKKPYNEEPCLCEEFVNGLKDGRIKRNALLEWRIYKDELKKCQENVQTIKDMEKCLENNDGKLAWEILTKPNSSKIASRNFPENHARVENGEEDSQFFKREFTLVEIKD